VDLRGVQAADVREDLLAEHLAARIMTLRATVSRLDWRDAERAGWDA
jgi:hypothetical protein